MWQTLGQDKILALIEHSIKHNELAHAYLIAGPRHVGKMTLAIELAQALNCQGEQPPCKECRQCQKIAKKGHADVIIINDADGQGKEPRTHTEISIDDIKELQRSASLPPYESKHKIFIINEAENLSHEAANRLLKTLEEPPPHVIIILLTANDSLLLPTITSRCRLLELKPLPRNEIAKILMTRYRVDEENAKFIANLSQGCPGWAINATQDNALLEQRAQFIEQMLVLLENSWGERLAYAAMFGDDKKLAEEMLKTWLSLWRDIMLLKYSCKEAMTNTDYEKILESLSQKISWAETRSVIDSLNKSLKYITTNANLRLLLEVVLLNMPKLQKATKVSAASSLN